MSKETILIVGASGLCGQYIARHFLDKANQYIVYTTSRNPLEFADHICHDFTDLPSPGKFPDRIDYVINCAGAVDQSHSAGYSIIDTNLRITYNVIKYSLLAKAACLIQFSSISVYGTPPGNGLIPEEYSLSPATSYGISKVLSEKLCSSMLTFHPRFFNLRLGYVLGPQIPERYFVSRFVAKLLKGEPVELVNPDTTYFSFIDIADITMVIEHLFTYPESATFNVVGDQIISVRKVFQTIQSFYPTALNLISESERPSDVFAARFSNQRIKQKLGIDRFRTFEESIGRIVEKVGA